MYDTSGNPPPVGKGPAYLLAWSPPSERGAALAGFMFGPPSSQLGMAAERTPHPPRLPPMMDTDGPPVPSHFELRQGFACDRRGGRAPRTACEPECGNKG